MATLWQPYSISKSRVLRARDPISGSFKYYGKELLNKINFPREHTTREKVRWENRWQNLTRKTMA